MSKVTFKPVAKAEGLSVYVSDCGRFRVSPRRITQRVGFYSRKITVWDLIERATGGTLVDGGSKHRCFAQAGMVQ